MITAMSVFFGSAADTGFFSPSAQRASTSVTCTRIWVNSGADTRGEGVTRERLERKGGREREERLDAP